MTIPSVSRGFTTAWATLAAASLALVCFFLPGVGVNLLYERAAMLRGEWWRLGTGHWVHFSGSHLFWNLAVLVPAGIWAERLNPARLRLLLLVVPWVIGVALLVFDPALETYGGLSGLAAAVLAFLALTQLAAGKDSPWFWRAVLVFLALKICAEFLAERPLFARFYSPDIHAVPLAHLIGVAGAVGARFLGRKAR